MRAPHAHCVYKRSEDSRTAEAAESTPTLPRVLVKCELEQDPHASGFQRSKGEPHSHAGTGPAAPNGDFHLVSFAVSRTTVRRLRFSGGFHPSC